MAHYTIGDALAHVASHNAHHAGQIVTIRQLMRIVAAARRQFHLVGGCMLGPCPDNEVGPGMIYSRSAEYAIRSFVYLARVPGGKFTMAAIRFFFLCMFEAFVRMLVLWWLSCSWWCRNY